MSETQDVAVETGRKPKHKARRNKQEPHAQHRKRLHAIAEDVTFLAEQGKTPLFFLDLHKVREQFTRFRQLFPTTAIYYSTKTNPHPAILRLVAARGAGFDVATLGEIRLVLQYGARPEDLLFTHPVKLGEEIQEAYQLGVRKFTLDSVEELRRHARYAPGGQNFVRIRPVSTASLYDYGKKFGADPGETERIMEEALASNIPIHGISFMIGSQSMSLEPWHDTLIYVQTLINKYYKRMPSLRSVNIGGGFPLPYAFKEVPEVEDIATIVANFAQGLPPDIRLMAEPGRFIAGPSTVLATRVVQRITRGDEEWLYTDANAYSGLIEIIENKNIFPYPITSGKRGFFGKFMIAGKTLDPDDILGVDVVLDESVSGGDILYIHNAGAYSSSFFTEYHALPAPTIVIHDSEFSHNVCIGKSGMRITGVKAKRKIPKGAVLFKITGAPVKRRSRTSFQVGRSAHVEPNTYGAFLNHSCDPNVGVRTSHEPDEAELEIVARRDIQAGEDIAADYAMFEEKTSVMSKVRCLCGSPKCRTFITGYKDLVEKGLHTLYDDLIADHLLSERA